METTEETTSGMNIGLVVALIAALAAIFLSILALGRALASDNPSSPAAAADGDGGGGVATASVDLAEFSITPATISLDSAGTLTLNNGGSAEHNFKVRETSVGTDNIPAGGTATLDLSSLSDGTYDVWCDIAGHAEAGMTGTLTIGGDATPTADAGENLTGEAKAEWLRANYEESVNAFLTRATEGVPEAEVFGAQVMEPTEVLGDGTKVFELVLDEVQWEVAPGEFVDAVGYNGQVPGPTLKVDVGDTVTIRIVNNLDDQTTTLHPHGIFMHPMEVDGVGYISHDPTFVGETDEWTMTMKEPSVGMYHGHDNGVHQVINGAFGAWIVGDWTTNNEYVTLPAEVDNVVAENVMILNDAGEIGLTLNGKSFPATTPYVLNKGEQMVMHYYNEGLTAHPMHLHNNAQLVIAKDGYPLAQPYFLDTVNIAPGERYTVVIFGEVPGAWVYHCHILSHVEKQDGSVFGMFTALIVNDSGDPAVDENTDRDAGDGRSGTPSSVDSNTETETAALGASSGG